MFRMAREFAKWGRSSRSRKIAVRALRGRGGRKWIDDPFHEKRLIQESQTPWENRDQRLSRFTVSFNEAMEEPYKYNNALADSYPVQFLGLTSSPNLLMPISVPGFSCMPFSPISQL